MAGRSEGDPARTPGAHRPGLAAAFHRQHGAPRRAAAVHGLPQPATGRARRRAVRLRRADAGRAHAQSRAGGAVAAPDGGLPEVDGPADRHPAARHGPGLGLVAGCAATACWRSSTSNWRWTWRPPPISAPFKRLGSDIPAAQRAALQAQGRDAVEQQVLPALRKLRAFIADEYIRQAPADGALRNYPDGAHVYDIVVRDQTTTALSAGEIHAIGQRELARLRGEMEAVMRQTKFDGDFAQFIGYLNTDPKFFAASPAGAAGGLPRHRQAHRRRIAAAVRATAAGALRRAFHAGLPRPGRRRVLRPAGARRHAPRLFQRQYAGLAHPAGLEDGHADGPRSRAGPPSADRAGGRTGRPAALSPQRRLHRVRRGLGGLCGDAGPRHRPVRRPVQPVRPSAMAGVPRRAAGGGHRHPQPGLVAAAGDRLHGRAHRHGPRLRQRRGGPLHLHARARPWAT